MRQTIVVWGLATAVACAHWRGLRTARAPYTRVQTLARAGGWGVLGLILMALAQAVLPSVGLSGMAAAALAAVGVLVLAYWRGVALADADSRPLWLRGSQVEEWSPSVTRSWWRWSHRDRRDALSRPWELCIGGLPIPELDETKHFKLIGTTGTGKSTAIQGLLAAALARGDRAVFADPDGGYLQRNYEANRGDLILNPFDRRSVVWQPFDEIIEPHDARELARALIGTASGEAAAWHGYAETFLAAVLERLKSLPDPSTAELYRIVASAPMPELRALLAGTSAAALVESGNERMFGSVRSIAMSRLAALPVIVRQSGVHASIRTWVREGSGVLFMPYKADQIASLRYLLSAWLRLAIFETMSLGESERRLWFVVDELDALGAIDGLKDALARLRKFGGRCVLGFQSIAQVSGTYGDAEARTIVENCATTLILRCSASDGGGTARFASQLIGQREVQRVQETESRGERDGLVRVSRTRQRVLESAVLAAEIEALADLEGYLKRASDGRWQRVRIRRSEAAS